MNDQEIKIRLENAGVHVPTYCTVMIGKKSGRHYCGKPGLFSTIHNSTQTRCKKHRFLARIGIQ